MIAIRQNELLVKDFPEVKALIEEDTNSFLEQTFLHENIEFAKTILLQCKSDPSQWTIFEPDFENRHKCLRIKEFFSFLPQFLRKKSLLSQIQYIALILKKYSNRKFLSVAKKLLAMALSIGLSQ